MRAISVTLILAGNTPLLAWSPICACLLAGVKTVRVKLSRDETVWTRLFVDSLREADPDLAARIKLYDFPGEDERTYALLQDADAVIVYGSDAAVKALRARTPEGATFFGYGHAVSIGLYLPGGNRELEARAYAGGAAQVFARDVLMYDQQGCLSPHTLYVSPLDKRDASGRSAAGLLAHRLASRFSDVSESLDTAPPTGPVAARVRTARDVAMFDGAAVRGDDGLRWTVIESPEPLPHPEMVGHGVVTVSPVASPEQLRELLQPVWGILSCAGVAGELSPEWKSVLRDAGVSRVCEAGEMQTPPLDWQNGNRDLLAELLHLRR